MCECCIGKKEKKAGLKSNELPVVVRVEKQEKPKKQIKKG
jgi:hypothetical protein